MIGPEIERFRQKPETDRLKKSAGLYAELYAEDGEIKELTESAMDGWPE